MSVIFTYWLRNFRLSFFSEQVRCFVFFHFFDSVQIIWRVIWERERERERERASVCVSILNILPAAVPEQLFHGNWWSAFQCVVPLQLAAYQTRPLTSWTTPESDQDNSAASLSACKTLLTLVLFLELNQPSIFFFFFKKWPNHKIILTVWQLHFVSYCKFMHWIEK